MFNNQTSGTRDWAAKVHLCIRCGTLAGRFAYHTSGCQTKKNKKQKVSPLLTTQYIYVLNRERYLPFCWLNNGLVFSVSTKTNKRIGPRSNESNRSYTLTKSKLHTNLMSLDNRWGMRIPHLRFQSIWSRQRWQTPVISDRGRNLPPGSCGVEGLQRWDLNWTIQNYGEGGRARGGGQLTVSLIFWPRFGFHA